jgi:outer membrane protein W
MMRRAAILAAAIAVAVVVTAADARAQGARPPSAPAQLGSRTVLTLGGHAFFMPGQTDLYPFAENVTRSLRFDSALLYDVAMIYGYTDRLIEFSVGQTTTTLVSGGTRAHVTMRPLLVTGQWRWYRPRRMLIPYLGAGAGVYRMRVRATSSFRDDIEDANADLDELEFRVDDVIGLHLVAGLEVLIAERFALTFDGRYQFLRTHARIEGTEVVDDEEVKRTREEYLRLDGPVYGVGLRVYF